MFDHRFAEQEASQHVLDLRAAADRRRRARAVRTAPVARRRWALAVRHRPSHAVVPTARLQDC